MAGKRCGGTSIVLDASQTSQICAKVSMICYLPRSMEVPEGARSVHREFDKSMLWPSQYREEGTSPSTVKPESFMVEKFLVSEIESNGWVEYGKIEIRLSRTKNSQSLL